MDPTIEPTATVERPRTVAKAIQFLASAVVIGLLNAIVTLVQRSSVQKMTGISMLVALIMVIAFFALLFFLVMKVSAGRKWARIVWLIFVILNAPFAILAYPDAVRRNIITGTLSIIIVILQLIGTGLLFTKDSNLWFRTRK
jgi:FtsH-binding integral membrane protein